MSGKCTIYYMSLMTCRKKSEKKIYARGGVNEKSVELAYKLGFHGIALYSYLWKSDVPFEKYINFIRFCKEKNILLE